MSDRKKLINLQKNISLNEVKNSEINFIERFISKDNISKLSTNSRNRIYTPKETLSMFISQAINQDSSCQNMVNKLALNKEKDICISTSAYCKARGRL